MQGIRMVRGATTIQSNQQQLSKTGEIIGVSSGVLNFRNIFSRHNKTIWGHN